MKYYGGEYMKTLIQYKFMCLCFLNCIYNFIIPWKAFGKTFSIAFAIFMSTYHLLLSILFCTDIFYGQL
jgi:hypothetical protein